MSGMSSISRGIPHTPIHPEEVFRESFMRVRPLSSSDLTSRYNLEMTGQSMSSSDPNRKIGPQIASISVLLSLSMSTNMLDRLFAVLVAILVKYDPLRRRDSQAFLAYCYRLFVQSLIGDYPAVLTPVYCRERIDRSVHDRL